MVDVVVPITFRKSSTAGTVPTAAVLREAEPAINTADRKLYSKDATAVFQVAPSMVEHNLKAPLASPAFTGTPTAPTVATTDNSASLATTAFVKLVVAALIDGAPGAIDTLNELAAALGDDPNFATTITNALALKAPIASPTFTGTVAGITKAMVGLTSVDDVSDANKPVSTAQAAAIALKSNLASPTFTGTPAAPTAAAGTSTTQLATTAFVTTAANLKANLASPALTGVPTSPTAAAGNATTQIATTAFVQTALAGFEPDFDGISGGTF